MTCRLQHSQRLACGFAAHVQTTTCHFLSSVCASLPFRLSLAVRPLAPVHWAAYVGAALCATSVGQPQWPACSREQPSLLRKEVTERPVDLASQDGPQCRCVIAQVLAADKVYQYSSSAGVNLSSEMQGKQGMYLYLHHDPSCGPARKRFTLGFCRQSRNALAALVVSADKWVHRDTHGQSFDAMWPVGHDGDENVIWFDQVDHTYLGADEGYGFELAHEHLRYLGYANVKKDALLAFAAVEDLEMAIDCR